MSPHLLLHPFPSLQVPFQLSSLFALFCISLSWGLVGDYGRRTFQWSLVGYPVGRQWKTMTAPPQTLSIVSGSAGKGKTLSMTDCWLVQTCAGQLGNHTCGEHDGSGHTMSSRQHLTSLLSVFWILHSSHLLFLYYLWDFQGVAEMSRLGHQSLAHIGGGNFIAIKSLGHISNSMRSWLVQIKEEREICIELLFSMPSHFNGCIGLENTAKLQFVYNSMLWKIFHFNIHQSLHYEIWIKQVKKNQSTKEISCLVI